MLITAQGDVRSGKLKCQENSIDEVHKLFCASFFDVFDVL